MSRNHASMPDNLRHARSRRLAREASAADITRLRRLAREKGYRVHVSFSDVDSHILITDEAGSLLLKAGFRGARCGRPFSAKQAANCLENALWSLA